MGNRGTFLTWSCLEVGHPQSRAEFQRISPDLHALIKNVLKMSANSQWHFFMFFLKFIHQIIFTYQKLHIPYFLSLIIGIPLYSVWSLHFFIFSQSEFPKVFTTLWPKPPTKFHDTIRPLLLFYQKPFSNKIVKFYNLIPNIVWVISDFLQRGYTVFGTIFIPIWRSRDFLAHEYKRHHISQYFHNICPIL